MTSRTVAIELKAGDLSVAVSVASIRQILPALGLMAVPLSRPQVAGVVARDGRAIPVYRLESVAGSAVVGGPDPEPATPVIHGTVERLHADLIVIVEHEGALAGILVESTKAVRNGADGSARIFDARTLLTRVGILDGDCGQQAAQTAQGDS
ncbi:MAG TPA: chemotaxis protein CheW [Patescibacteria group bacterium]|nr:chemotaxis protein CheW [Patescibacteria group bacterium]